MRFVATFIFCNSVIVAGACAGVGGADPDLAETDSGFSDTAVSDETNADGAGDLNGSDVRDAAQDGHADGGVHFDVTADPGDDAIVDANDESGFGFELPERGFCSPNDDIAPVRPPVDEPATLPFLHVQGRAVVDPEGNPVALRGFNLGSWLAMETWVTGIGEATEDELLAGLEQKAAELGLAALLEEARAANGFDWLFENRTHRQLIDEWREYCVQNAPAGQESAVRRLWAWFDDQPWVLEEESFWRFLGHRFGMERSEQLRTAFQEHYVTEVDVRRAAELGLNLLRVPVWYQTLESELPAGNTYREAGWLRLHELAVWARRHKVYLMLDLHGAPGGQSTSAHQGLAAGGQIWDHPECIDKTARIWKDLAAYFRDEPHVAIYDLLNEPMNCPDRASYQAVHQAVYDAIREVDQNHIVCLEDGFLSASKLVSPKEMGWVNAMFSFHFYPWSADSADSYFKGTQDEIQRIADLFERYECPVLAGEFAAASGKESGPWAREASDRVLKLLNDHGIHWTIWTWKFFADWALWGLFHPTIDPWKRVPVKDASFDEIMSALVGMDSSGIDGIRSGFTADAEYARIVSERAADPALPLSFELP